MYISYVKNQTTYNLQLIAYSLQLVPPFLLVI